MTLPAQQVYVQGNRNGLAASALVFGALATLTSCIPVLPWVLAVLGLCFAGVAILVSLTRGGSGLGMAMGGLVLCLLSLLPILVLGGIFFGGALSAARDAAERAKQRSDEGNPPRAMKLQPPVIETGAPADHGELEETPTAASDETRDAVPPVGPPANRGTTPPAGAPSPAEPVGLGKPDASVRARGR